MHLLQINQFDILSDFLKHFPTSFFSGENKLNGRIAYALIFYFRFFSSLIFHFFFSVPYFQIKFRIFCDRTQVYICEFMYVTIYLSVFVLCVVCIFIYICLCFCSCFLCCVHNNALASKSVFIISCEYLLIFVFMYLCRCNIKQLHILVAAVFNQ